MKTIKRSDVWVDRDGAPVIIISIDSDGEYPVVVISAAPE